MGLHLNKLESPSQKDAQCQVWLKLSLIKERFFIWPFYYNLPLEKSLALHLNKLKGPLKLLAQVS